MLPLILCMKIAAISAPSVIGDHGISGTTIKRRGLEDLLGSLERGDTLVVWKLDRLGRSTLHLLTLLDDLRARGVDFVAVTQGIDTTTAVGRMVFGQLAVFAEFEREQIRERTKAGMEAARRRGVHIGRPYAKLSKAQMREIKALGLSGRSLKEIALRFKVSSTTIQRALHSSCDKPHRSETSNFDIE